MLNKGRCTVILYTPQSTHDQVQVATRVSGKRSDLDLFITVALLSRFGCIEWFYKVSSVKQLRFWVLSMEITPFYCCNCLRKWVSYCESDRIRHHAVCSLHEGGTKLLASSLPPTLIQDMRTSSSSLASSSTAVSLQASTSQIKQQKKQ